MCWWLFVVFGLLCVGCLRMSVVCGLLCFGVLCVVVCVSSVDYLIVDCWLVACRLLLVGRLRVVCRSLVVLVRWSPFVGWLFVVCRLVVF